MTKEQGEQLSVSSPNISLKEVKFAHHGLMEFKEEDGQLVLKGYIATTHKDAVGDVIKKETLEKWVKEINDALPRVNKVSYHHDRQDPRVVGVALKGSARVDRLPDGHYGLYVETIVNKAHELYEDISYEYKIGALDSFSIEYSHPTPKESGDNSVRFLGTETELYGWTLASRPINDNAVMIKEMISSSNRSSSPEQSESRGKEMAEDEKLSALEAQLKELQEFKAKVMSAEEAERKKKMEEECKEAEAKKLETQKKETIAAVLESKEFSEKLDALAKTPKMETKEVKQLPVELKEYMEIGKKELSTTEQLARAVKLSMKAGLFEKGTRSVDARIASGYEYKNFMANGVKLEAKGLGIGDNVTAQYVDDTTGIGLPQAELQEVVDPVLYNALNDEISLFNVVAKDNKAGSGSNSVTFVLQTGRNPTAGAYSGNEVSLGKSTRAKYTTKFKKYQAGFALDGDLLAANKGANIGDAMAIEMQRAMVDLKKAINADLYTEQGLETGDQIIGLKYLADSAGNATLYSVTRSAANKLNPDAAGDTYKSGAAGLTKPLLRAAIRQIVVDGGSPSNAVIACHPIQYDKLKELYDNEGRIIAPMSGALGFGQTLSFEGVPIIQDVDCPTGSIFVFDKTAFRMAFWVPPTVEMLGKRNDSSEGFVKTYFATYCTAPRRVVEIYSLPTA